MQVRDWAVGLFVVLSGCSGKPDSGETGESSDAICESADLSDPDCESGTAVIRIAVTASGAAAPGGTTVHVQDCAGIDTVMDADTYGEARFNMPAATYVIWADNSEEGLASTSDTHDIPGCGTTSIDLAMSGS